MPPAPTDLTGQRFGRLVAVSYTPGTRYQHGHWTCNCDCGRHAEVAAGSLRAARGTLSCGCLLREMRHGMRKANASEYVIWQSIKTRCYYVGCKNYKNYGGRGIRMCQRWLDSFMAFYADMGPRPSMRHSIDRIDNDGNYEPGNCRWVTQSYQSRNKRSTRLATINGKTMCLRDWSIELGFRPDTLYARIDRLGWPLDLAVSTPLQPRYGGKKIFLNDTAPEREL